MIFLAIAALTLVAALVYGSFVEGKRHDALVEELKQLRQHNATLRKEQIAHESRIATLGENLVAQDQKAQATFKAMKQNLDIMEVRQRTLEKKIISSERTVNLVFTGKVPVEHSNEPVIKVKKPRGKAALFPEGASI